MERLDKTLEDNYPELNFDATVNDWPGYNGSQLGSRLDVKISGDETTIFDKEKFINFIDGLTCTLANKETSHNLFTICPAEDEDYIYAEFILRTYPIAYI